MPVYMPVPVVGVNLVPRYAQTMWLLLLLFPSVALAQGYAPQRLPRAVVAYPPDGGIEAVVTNRVDTSPTSAPGTSIYVTGVDGADVDVKGAVSLTGLLPSFENVQTFNLPNNTLNLLAGQRTCVDYPVGNVTIDAGVFEFPAYPGQQTAAITMHNFGATVDYIACFRGWQSDGGPPPSCALGSGVANVPIHSGDTFVVDGLADSHRIRCTACTHSGPPSGGTALAGGAISVCTPSP